MKLELKHLTPYLPYELKGKEYPDGAMYELLSLSMDKFSWRPFYESGEFGRLPHRIDCKPILHPLSDLTKEIEVDGEKFVPAKIVEEKFIERFKVKSIGDGWADNLTEYLRSYPYGMIELLIKWHFDVFGLIESGLAIDINTL